MLITKHKKKNEMSRFLSLNILSRSLHWVPKPFLSGLLNTQDSPYDVSYLKTKLCMRKVSRYPNYTDRISVSYADIWKAHGLTTKGTHASRYSWCREKCQQVTRVNRSHHCLRVLTSLSHYMHFHRHHKAQRKPLYAASLKEVLIMIKIILKYDGDFCFKYF